MELHIVLDAKGNVAVSGPIGNKVLCLGMLEAAKEAVLGFCREKAKEESRIEIAPADLLGKIH